MPESDTESVWADPEAGFWEWWNATEVDDALLHSLALIVARNAWVASFERLRALLAT